MAKDKVYLSGKVVISSTFSQIAEPVDKSKVRSRGPKHLGQAKETKVVRLGKVDQEALGDRLLNAEKLLQTGKVPAKLREESPKVTNATIAKAKGDLTKANNKLAAEKEKVAKLEKEVADLKEELAKVPKETPPETPTKDTDK